MLFPTLQIDALTSARLRDPDQTAKAGCDIALFVSANAVHCANRIRPLVEQVAGTRTVMAIGAATARALVSLGIDIPPTEYPRSDSEALLQDPNLRNISGQTVYLYKGRGGRTVIADTLVRRGADIVLCEVYERCLPRGVDDEAAAKASLALDVIQSGSDEALDNLVTLTPVSMRDRLFKTTLLVNSERGKHHAIARGFRSDILVAHPAGDDGQLAALARLATIETARA